MSIIFKCKCGRTTTYGLKCVACAGLTLEFVKRKNDHEDDDEPDEDNEPKHLDRPAPRKNK